MRPLITRSLVGSNAARVGDPPSPIAHMMPSPLRSRKRALLHAGCLIATLALCACKGKHFTSCVDDSTPCESSETSGELSAAITEVMTTSTVASPASATTTALEPTSVPNTDGKSTAPQASAPAPTDATGSETGLLHDGSSGFPMDQTLPSDEAGAPTLVAVDAGDTTSAVATQFSDASSFEAVTGDSLITNGDFVQGIDNWKVEQTSGQGQHSVEIDDGVLCIESEGAVELTVGWPADASAGAQLQAGAYQFSFKARGTRAEMTAKVGLAVAPYTALAEVDWEARVAWDSSVSTFTSQDHPSVGVALFIKLSRGRVCVDDIEVRPIIDGPAPMSGR